MNKTRYSRKELTQLARDQIYDVHWKGGRFVMRAPLTFIVEYLKVRVEARDRVLNAGEHGVVLFDCLHGATYVVTLVSGLSPEDFQGELA